jgi:hypothetical protein
VSQTVELLWFSDYPNHPAARAMLEEVTADVAPGTPIRDIDTTDPVTAASVRSRARRRSASTAATSTQATSTPATTRLGAACTGRASGCAVCRNEAGLRTR